MIVAPVDKPVEIHGSLRLKEMQPSLSVRVWRGDRSGGQMVRYQVPEMANQTILDVVTWVQQNAEPDLGYRFACRVGMCGSCAMTVNGKPRWTCRTHVKKVTDTRHITIEPLRNLPVVKDLVCDLTPFFDKWTEAKGQFYPSKTRYDAVESLSPDSPQRKAADDGIECINCAVCYAACDTVTWNPDYFGPAALNRAWTLFNDVRDTHQTERLQAISSKKGCHNCHSHQSCRTLCPNGLNPTAAIAGLKRMATRAILPGRTSC